MNGREAFVLTIGIVSAAGCFASGDTDLEGDAPEAIATTQQSVTLDQRIAACAVDPRVTVGLVTNESCVGADLFLRETFNGNGRSCATCHPVAHNFTID